MYVPILRSQTVLVLVSYYVVVYKESFRFMEKKYHSYHHQMLLLCEDLTQDSGHFKPCGIWAGLAFKCYCRNMRIGLLIFGARSLT